MIEKVMMDTTLKAGKDIWVKGSFLNAPLPQVILDEIAYQTGTVKVIKGDLMPGSKLVFVSERVAETATSMTTMAVPEKKPPPLVVKPIMKTKNKLIRR